MAKKSRTTEQAPSRARKTPIKRSTQTAPKSERDNTLDVQSTKSSSLKTAATTEHHAQVTPAAVEESPQTSLDKDRSETQQATNAAVAQADKRKKPGQSQSKSGTAKSSASTPPPAAAENIVLQAETKPATPPKSSATSAKAVETTPAPPQLTAQSEQFSAIIETPETSPDETVTLTAQAEQPPPSTESAAEVSPAAATEAAIMEQLEQGAVDETPSMEEILAAAQPVQETLDEQPQYMPPPLANKYLNKEALRDRLWLRKDYKPIISYVGRLDFQKGVHLIRHGIFYALEHGAQFVLLGTSPEHKINEEFWHLKRQLNDSPDCHLEIGFNEELSHLIYAGSDMIIMPSLYEPCGLTQMLSLKYGTVPIVRWVGGLADTVFDKDHSHKPLHERNGYVFTEPDAQGLESAMSRAIGCWYSYPDDFRQLVINGMRYDYSWNYPGQHYLNIYEHIRCK
ncbi:MAG: glycosyltransferase [Candidatus Competibacteraceae bacterium]|nr:glycosyltransferase [Candidatus Competibacteraceae bacterium]